MSEFLSNTGQIAPDVAGDASIVSRVCQYWTELRRDGATPKRRDVDSRALSDLLPHVFLAELVTPRVARLRICGHRIEDILGMDMRGMPLSVLFQGTARNDIAEALEQVQMGARVILSVESQTGFGQPKITATVALMPLADEVGRITRIMGVIERQGEIGRAPRRFALAKPVADAQPTTPAPRKRPALRVIDGGRA